MENLIVDMIEVFEVLWHYTIEIVVEVVIGKIVLEVDILIAMELGFTLAIIIGLRDTKLWE